MPRATSSLPVPVSPSIRTAIGDAAALSISRNTEAMGAPVPIMGSKLPRRARSRRNTPTWARSCSAEAFSCSQRRAFSIAAAEGSAAAAVHDLEHAERATLGRERRAEDAPRAEPRVPVDVGVEAGIDRRVVDAYRLPAAQHGTGAPLVGGKAEVGERPGHLRVLLGDVGEVELGSPGVEQQDRRAFGIEHLAAFADHERDQLVEL